VFRPTGGEVVARQLRRLLDRQRTSCSGYLVYTCPTSQQAICFRQLDAERGYFFESITAHSHRFLLEIDFGFLTERFPLEGGGGVS
jgi:hypothetical protein